MRRGSKAPPRGRIAPQTLAARFGATAHEILSAFVRGEAPDRIAAEVFEGQGSGTGLPTPEPLLAIR
ncbi:MAG: hypothetical protein HYV07_32550 [Deltaproteobacteria bacterium]|nr:hypothetical protein [Deltaproteobacteria bacterium]